MKKLFILLILLIPTFSLALRLGIWTMHDFHVFRQFEFNLCAQEFAFPCRWAPDASLGFGQPVFNFYGQMPYIYGQLIHLFGFGIVDSVKLTFFASLILSGVTMYLLASHLWGKAGGLLSALFYVYAPYRAVDVWVRGALPEALSFVYFPLILYFLEKKKFWWASVFITLLLLTHNLSFFMFAPFLGIWWLVRSRNLRLLLFIPFVIALSAFYWLPVLIESHLVSISDTTSGYYNFALHFVSLNQLLISRFWGYGGSVWGPNDTLSFSVGQLHWVLAFFMLPLSIIKFGFSSKQTRLSILLVLLSVLAVFLTHGKSEILWKFIPGLKFVQFPWRFLSMSTLFLSLSVGLFASLSRKFIPLIIVALILLNYSWFTPDIWRPVTDKEQFSGTLWQEQRSSALTDFWPKDALVPTHFAPELPQFTFGTGEVSQKLKLAHTQKYEVKVDTDYAKLVFPTVYFPGWQVYENQKPTQFFPDPSSQLITIRVPKGNNSITLRFQDTPVRHYANLISLFTLLSVLSYLIIQKVNDSKN